MPTQVHCFHLLGLPHFVIDCDKDYLVAWFAQIEQDVRERSMKLGTDPSMEAFIKNEGLE